jgi:two-component system response regulator FixJ
MQESDGATNIARRIEVEQKLAMLSIEERRVFDGLTNGQSTASIAQGLQLVPRAVEIHRANLMTKMQASSLSDLVRMALFSPVERPAGE